MPSPPPKFVKIFFFKILPSPAKINTKSIISQKLRIVLKKSCMQKVSVRSFPIIPANLTTYEENQIFGRPKRPFWTPVAPKRDMKFHAHLYFSTLCIFCVEMATSEGRWVCISLVGKHLLANSYADDFIVSCSNSNVYQMAVYHQILRSGQMSEV